MKKMMYLDVISTVSDVLQLCALLVASMEFVIVRTRALATRGTLVANATNVSSISLYIRLKQIQFKHNKH